MSDDIAKLQLQLDEARAFQRLTSSALNEELARTKFDLVAHLERQRQFSEKTFGPGDSIDRVAGLSDHIKKELVELEREPMCLEEWIDVVILGLDGAWRTGASSMEIAKALEAKQAKNEKRVWPDWRSAPKGKAIEHVRSQGETHSMTIQEAINLLSLAARSATWQGADPALAKALLEVLRSVWDPVVQSVVDERDAARAEVERLRQEWMEVGATQLALKSAEAEVERLKQVVADATESVRMREEETLDHARERDEARAILLKEREAARREVELLEEERDEARAEVERLKVERDGARREEAKAWCAEAVELRAERDEALRELEVSRRARKATEERYARMASDVLAELAGAGIATPEKGYMVESWAVSGDIARLAKERDEARAEVERFKRATATAWQSVCAARAWAFDPSIDHADALRLHYDPLSFFAGTSSAVLVLDEEAFRAQCDNADPKPTSPLPLSAERLAELEGDAVVSAVPGPRLFGRDLDLPSGVLATAEAPKPTPPVDVPNLGPRSPADLTGERPPTNSVVEHPAHYTAGKVECIDAIEAATTGLIGIEAVCTANAIKYLWRWKRKNGAEDLEKAHWYIDMLITSLVGHE